MTGNVMEALLTLMLSERLGGDISAPADAAQRVGRRHPQAHRRRHEALTDAGRP